MTNRRSTISLRLSFILGVLFVAASIGLYFFSSSFLAKRADALLTANIRALAYSVEHYLLMAKTDLGLLLADKTIDDYFMYAQLNQLDAAEDARWRVESKLLRVSLEKPQYLSIKLLGLDGISVVDITGNRASYDRRNFSETPWFQKTSGLGKTGWHIAGPFHSAGSQDPQMLVGRAYYNDLDAASGVMAVQFSTETYLSDALRGHHEHTGYAYIIDKEGVIVAHCDITGIGRRVDHLLSTRDVLSGASGMVTEEAESGDILMRKAYAPLEIAGISVVAAQPLSAIQEYGRPLRLFCLAVSIVTVLFVAVIGLAVRRLRRNEQAIGLAHAELDQVFNTAANAMCVVDRDYNVLRVNDAYLALTGTGREEAAGSKCFELFYGTKCHSPDCTLTRALQSGDRLQYEVEKQRKDGTTVSCILTATPFRSLDGEIVGIVEDFQDISGHQRATEEIRIAYEAQAMLNKLLRLSFEDLTFPQFLMLFLHDITSVPWFSLQAKGAAFLVEDHAPETLVLKAPYDLNKRLETLCARVPFGKCLCGRAALSREILFAGCVGEDHDVRYDGMPPHGHYCIPITFAEKILGVITLYVEENHRCTPREIDFLKAASDVLAEIIIRKRAEEESLRLERRLLQSEKMASVGQLAAGVAHEINNPTGFVSSNLNTLHDYQNDLGKLLGLHQGLVEGLKQNLGGTNLPPSIADKVHEIEAFAADIDIDFIMKDIPNLVGDCREGTERIKKIVLDLKDFAHPGHAELQFADINKGLESTLNVVWNELKYKAEVTKDYGRLPEVQCYPQELNQVFMNILVNAAQAIEKRGEIRIATRALDNKVEISISDTGSGIPEEILPKIFDPFFTTKDVGKGTGLGLNVAYNIIVAKHKGTIDVKSTAGKGTTFTIQIPVSFHP